MVGLLVSAVIILVVFSIILGIIMFISDCISDWWKELKRSYLQKVKSEGIIHIGDTKDVIKAILGNPDSIIKHKFSKRWYYGSGYIEFRFGRVSGSSNIKIDPIPRGK